MEWQPVPDAGGSLETKPSDVWDTSGANTEVDDPECITSCPADVWDTSGADTEVDDPECATSCPFPHFKEGQTHHMPVSRKAFRLQEDFVKYFSFSYLRE